MIDYCGMFHRESREGIQIAHQKGLINRLIWEGVSKKEWTYVENYTEASVFKSEAEAEQCRDMYCRFPWIVIRPLSGIEKDLHRLAREVTFT